MEAAEAFKLIKQQTRIPIVADIHFDYRIALKVAEYGADCLRINPGNIGNEERVRAVVDCARHYNIPIRIGVNGGSLERDLQEKYGEPTPEALLESAMRHVDYLDRLDFQNFKVSVKASDVFLAVGAYRLLAKQIDQPCIWASRKRAVSRRRGQVRHWPWHVAERRDWRHPAHLPGRRSGGRGEGGLRHPQIPAHPFPRHQLHRLSLLLPSGVRRHRHGQCPGRAARRHHHPDGCLHHRLCGERSGEALVSDLGLAGAANKSAFYEGGQRVDRLDNKDLIPTLERRIRARAAMLDPANQIQVDKG